MGYAAVAVERRAGSQTSHYIAVYRMYRNHFDIAARSNPSKYIRWYPQKPSTTELTALAQQLSRERGAPFTVHPASYQTVRTPTPGWSMQYGTTSPPQQTIQKDPSRVTDVPGDDSVFNKTIIEPAIHASAQRHGVTLTPDQADDLIWLVGYHSLYDKRGIEAARPENISQSVQKESKYTLIPGYIPEKLSGIDKNGQPVELDTRTYYANGVAVWTRGHLGKIHPYLGVDDRGLSDKMYQAADPLNRHYLLGIGDDIGVSIAAYAPDTETILLNLQAANSMYMHALDYIRQNNIVPQSPEKEEIEKQLALDIAGIFAGRIVNHELVHHMQRVGEMMKDFLMSEKAQNKLRELKEAIFEEFENRGLTPPSEKNIEDLFNEKFAEILNWVTDSSINALPSVNPMPAGVYPKSLGLKSPRDPETLMAQMIDRINPKQIAEEWAKEQQQSGQQGGQQSGQQGGQQGDQQGGGGGKFDPNRLFTDAIRRMNQKQPRGLGGDPGGGGTGGDPIGTNDILSIDQMRRTIEKDLKDAGVNDKIAAQAAASAVRNHQAKWFGSGMTSDETPITIRRPVVRRNPVLDELLRHISNHVTDVPPGAEMGSVPSYSGINWAREVAQMNLPNRRVFPTERKLYTRPVVVMVDTSGSQLNDEDLQKAVDSIYSILSKHRGQQVYVGHWSDGMTPATIHKPIILEGGRSSKEHIKRALQSVQSGGKHLSSSLHHLSQAINKGRVVVNNQRLSAPEWGKLRNRRPSALLVITDGHIGSDDAEAVASDRYLMHRDFDEDAPLPPMFVLYTHDMPNTLREHLDAIPHCRHRHAYVGDRGDTE